MLKLLAVAAVLVAACGDNYDSVALDDYPAALRDALCQHAVACGDVADLETCRTSALGELQRLTASQRAALDAGVIEFRDADAQTCIAAIAARSCDVTSQSSRVLPDACFTTFVGTQGAGGACASNAACISGLCDVPLCDAACCTGTCVGGEPPVRAAVGASCEAARCIDTAFCDDAAICVARKGAGSLCLFSDDCQFGLDCSADGACTTLPAAGEPCDGACRDEGTTCSTSLQICVPVALAGEPCEMTSDCSVLYVCDAGGRCSEGIALGAACTAGQRCADLAAFCDAPAGESQGTCAVRKPIGQPCTSDGGCESRTCDPVSSTCVAEPVCT